MIEVEDLDFDLSDFNIREINKSENKTIKLKLEKLKKVDIKNAADLAKKISIKENETIHCIVDGSFIYLDFILALLIEKEAYNTNIYISTLSLNEENLKSLKIMKKMGYINNIVLMSSTYFYSHYKNTTMKAVKTELGENQKIIIIRNHCKIILLDVNKTIKIVLTGSPNIRSSRCYEQIAITQSKELYNYYLEYFEKNKKYEV